MGVKNKRKISLYMLKFISPDVHLCGDLVDILSSRARAGAECDLEFLERRTGRLAPVAGSQTQLSGDKLGPSN